MRLIRRNQRKLAEAIFSNAKNIMAYTLDNDFVGKPCQKLDFNGENWLFREWNQFSFARLIEGAPNHFCLDIHSNCWYDFEN
jgi:hypothetical protein